MANDDMHDDDENNGPEFIFEDAKREGIKALVMFYGESGSGKTKSALRFAEGLDPKGVIGLVDTEAGRGRHYANEHTYKYTELKPPFSPARYRMAIEAAKKQGVTTLILDSLSHVHEGQGGLIDMAESSGMGDTFAKWNKPKREWKKLRDYMLHCGMHLIFCARAKDPLEKDPNDSRKMIRGEIVPIVPRGWAYEITISLGLDALTHEIIPVKLSNEIAGAFPLDQYISESSGAMVRQWLNGQEIVDEAFESLKEAGREQARKGLDALKAWFTPLDGKLRVRLKTFLDNELKPLASGQPPATPAASGADDSQSKPPARGGKSSAPSEKPAQAQRKTPSPPPPPPAPPPPAKAKREEPPPKEDDDPGAGEFDLDLDEDSGGQVDEGEGDEEEIPPHDYPPISIGNPPDWSRISSDIADFIEGQPEDCALIERVYAKHIAAMRADKSASRQMRMLDSVIAKAKL